MNITIANFVRLRDQLDTIYEQLERLERLFPDKAVATLSGDMPEQQVRRVKRLVEEIHDNIDDLNILEVI